MKVHKLVFCVVISGLALLALAACGPSGPDMTPGEIKGVFVDKSSGQPVEFSPGVFAIHGDRTEEELTALETNEIQVETDSTGAFSLTNVLPGEYALMDGSYKTILVVDVEPGQVVDVGTLEIEP